jgi:hypothetical protein
MARQTPNIGLDIVHLGGQLGFPRARTSSRERLAGRRDALVLATSVALYLSR